MSLLLLGLFAILIYLAVNLFVWLRVGNLMSAPNNYSMCDIASAPRCVDYANRSNEEIEEVFSKPKNKFSVIAAIKIYNRKTDSYFQELQNKQELTEEEKEWVDNKIRMREYHEKIMKIVNENIDFDQMSFIDKMVYESLLKR